MEADRILQVDMQFNSHLFDKIYGSDVIPLCVSVFDNEHVVVDIESVWAKWTLTLALVERWNWRLQIRNKINTSNKCIITSYGNTCSQLHI